MIDGKNFFDQPVKNDQRTYDNIKKLQQAKEIITQLAVYCIMFLIKMILK